jgi:hypothetical protein
MFYTSVILNVLDFHLFLIWLSFTEVILGQQIVIVGGKGQFLYKCNFNVG